MKFLIRTDEHDRRDLRIKCESVLTRFYCSRFKLNKHERVSYTSLAVTGRDCYSFQWWDLFLLNQKFFEGRTFKL